VGLVGVLVTWTAIGLFAVDFQNTKFGESLWVKIVYVNFIHAMIWNRPNMGHALLLFVWLLRYDVVSPLQVERLPTL